MKIRLTEAGYQYKIIIINIIKLFNKVCVKDRNTGKDLKEGLQ